MSAVSKESEDEAEAAGTSSMMESSMMEGEEYYNPDTTVAWSEKVSGGEQLCRICAGPNEYLIPIFSGEGLEHQLGMKIEKHLPIQVLEHDKLPVQVCYQCASTLIAWHDLVVGCVEAEKKLRQLYQQQNVEEEEEEDDFGDDDRTELFADPVDSEMAEDPLEPSTSTSTATRSTRSPRKKSVTRAKPKLKMTLVKTPAALPKSPPKLLQPKEEQVEADPATERFRPTLPSRLSLPKHPIKLRAHKAGAYFKCSICSETFKTPDSLAIHVATHSVMFPLSLEQRMAKADVDKLNDKPGLSEVLKLAKFQCDICERILKSKHKLMDHRRTHTGERPYTCHVCGKQFAGNAGLWRHVKSVHENVKDCVCDVCGKAYKTNRDLNDHRRSHTGETPFVCEVCGKAYKTSATLYLHRQSHSDIRPFSCKHCEKKFKRSSHLVIHMRRAHTFEKPHSCGVCEKSFVSHSELAKHGVIHSEDEPFACAQCGERFRARRNLANHEKCQHMRDVGDN